MGFLDRMLSDLVGDATGLNPRTVRRAVKMVGGKNIVMAGVGAALAGGIATAANQRQGGQPVQGGACPSDRWSGGPAAPPPQTPSAPPPSAPTAAPPPPPLPTAAVPAPPVPAAAAPAAPPVAQVPAAQAPATPEPPEAPAAEEDDAPPAELVFAITRTMVAAALADGHLDDRERQLIHDRLGESGLSAEQIQQVHRDLVLPPAPRDLAAMTDDPQWREDMFRFAGMVILADGQVSDFERSWLERLADDLAIDAERRSELRRELFPE